ncbi:MAG: NADH:ubiquinone oxidoreductase subunit NDUFA12 [Alphaproteobacteria bacterium]|nr:NADH:ubiquinone oxidoreductase subunit NDUFA12 [Alphaproteobacteria bacterium]MBE8220940.1 NADH:ubiquinone oxidoreductase subunit NDUFA12 [Alphaproteobacteria bacterium]
MRMSLTWWHSQTFGTALHTWSRGDLVGEDVEGNRYYQDKSGRSINGKPRRWVIYNGDIEATRVPPLWHGWLHYTQDVAPNAEGAGLVHRHWQKPHQRNMTGTKSAHQPIRADIAAGGTPEGYHAWSPDKGGK